MRKKNNKYIESQQYHIAPASIFVYIFVFIFIFTLKITYQRMKQKKTFLSLQKKKKTTNIYMLIYIQNVTVEMRSINIELRNLITYANLFCHTQLF